MFQVDVADLLSNKFQLMSQDTNVQTTTADSWYYWEYEMYIKSLNEKNKQEKEQQEKQDKEQKDNSGGMNGFNPSKLMSGFNSNNMGGTSSFPRF